MSAPKYWAVLLPDTDNEIQIKDPSAGMRIIHRIPVAPRTPAVALAAHGYVIIGKFCVRGDGYHTALVKRSK